MLFAGGGERVFNTLFSLLPPQAVFKQAKEKKVKRTGL